MSPGPPGDMADNIALAKDARKNQGSFEMEVTFGDEADLHRHYIDCQKNPGHDKFISVNQFCMEHLPTQYQDPDIVDLVKAQSGLTVRVQVKCISDKRPDIHPVSKEPYPFIAYRGSKRIGRTGTGFVHDVNKYKGTQYNLCKCHTCVTSGQREILWGESLIETATHVVFDQPECDYTRCTLFYDTSSTKVKDLPSLEKMDCSWNDVQEDKTIMSYKTHDMQLLDEMEKMISHYRKLHKIVNAKSSQIRLRQMSASSDASKTDTEPKLTIIVSHPHGCSKMVTVGEWIKREESGTRDTQYTYNTATCPGSSGARVFILGRERTYICRHLHKGSSLELGVNCSGIAEDGFFRHETVLVPASKIWDIENGSYKEKLVEIQRKANVSMWIDHVSLHRVSIYGLSPNVRQARGMVEDLLADKDDKRTGETGQQKRRRKRHCSIL